MGSYQTQLCVEMNMHYSVEKMNMHDGVEKMCEWKSDERGVQTREHATPTLTASRGGRQVQGNVSDFS